MGAVVTVSKLRSRTHTSFLLKTGSPTRGRGVNGRDAVWRPVTDAVPVPTESVLVYVPAESGANTNLNRKVPAPVLFSPAAPPKKVTESAVLLPKPGMRPTLMGTPSTVALPVARML